jgi:hypothetical protein
MTYTLYHGTTQENAKRILKDGFLPGVVPVGANQGESRFLYLTNFPENAAWFAEQSGGDVVLVLTDVSEELLRVDPHDGTCETVTEELTKSSKMPGSVVLFKPLAANSFKLYSGSLD